MKIYFVLIAGCVPEKFGYSTPTQPTADWPSLERDSAIDTAAIESFTINPEDATGFGTGMYCTDFNCWITAPYGSESQLYKWGTELELYATLPSTVGNVLVNFQDTPLMNGPDGLYTQAGLVQEEGPVGAFACKETECVFATKDGVQNSNPTNQNNHRPKAIVIFDEQGIWQNNDGTLANEAGLRSDWSGAEVHSIDVVNNTLWIGVPAEKCIHKFNASTFEMMDSWCNNVETFGHVVKAVSEDALMVGAPNANGGRGHLSYWIDGILEWQIEGDTGGNFGTTLALFEDKILVSEPSANNGTGQVHGISWP